MPTNKTLLNATIGSLLALGALSIAGQGVAQEADTENCYGVVKAGKNDCAGPGHTCQGQAKTDGDPNEFITVPAGTCERLVNGSTTPGSGSAG
jgi:uncharacterized membrane protein